MEVNCEGCAGCCIDWRPLAGGGDRESDHERRGKYRPLDDTYNLAPLTRDEVRAFLESGLVDATTPRVWEADDGVSIDGHELAAIGGKPAFFVGLRKVPKPVAPFERPPTWLPTCVFLDPSTLQCRIHGDDLYPDECASYPGHNLELSQETECERVEASFGGERLVDDAPPEETGAMLLGPQAIGQKVFVHPDPDRLDGAVERIAAGEPTAEDRAEFVAVAVASSPGAPGISQRRYEEARERALDADSWLTGAIDEWRERSDAAGKRAPSPGDATAVEDERGAPSTPGWD